jgi:SSS family solute:Na+ symporter
MPDWFAALFMLCILSASMSTLSSQFHTMGTAAGRDLYEKTLGKTGNTMMITRVGILIVIVMSTAIAWFSNGLPIAEGIIAKFTSIFFELTTAAFLPMYIGALYFRKMPRAAAKASMIAGSVSWFIWTFFIHSNASYFQICNLVFGKHPCMNTSLQSWSMVGTTMIALPVSILAMAICLDHLCGEKEKLIWIPHTLEGCFAGIGEKKAE